MTGMKYFSLPHVVLDSTHAMGHSMGTAAVVLPLHDRGMSTVSDSTRVDPFRTAVPFWGQTTRISGSLSPKRDSGPKRVNETVVRVLLS